MSHNELQTTINEFLLETGLNGAEAGKVLTVSRATMHRWVRGQETVETARRGRQAIQIIKKLNEADRYHELAGMEFKDRVSFLLGVLRQG